VRAERSPRHQRRHEQHCGWGAAPSRFQEGAVFPQHALIDPTNQGFVRAQHCCATCPHDSSIRGLLSVIANPKNTKTTMPLHNFTLSQSALTGLLTTLLPVLVQFALFLRWLHRRMREDEIVHACVRDIALNHLPHIYNSLQAIGAKQGITLHEFPVIHFVDLGTRRHSA
jgi:hypothetical protein